ncbi:MAG: hypothetical protein V2I26_08525 [Halieaceae bacterium]|jgi:hypothetical protein|nr:hypothetical protein [Halieaceae bacterium]
MTAGARDLRRRERAAKMTLWLADHASRNRSLFDRLCRKILALATRRAPDQDFMRDPLIDNDTGFDPDELDRYQRGE